MRRSPGWYMCCPMVNVVNKVCLLQQRLVRLASLSPVIALLCLIHFSRIHVSLHVATMYSRLSVGALALSLCGFALAQDNCTTTCQSFGVDFVDDGSYFQNIDSTAPFTAVQEFEGCQDDEANNILVDPSGNQYECSQTPLTPDDTAQTMTWYVHTHSAAMNSLMLLQPYQQRSTHVRRMEHHHHIKQWPMRPHRLHPPILALCWPTVDSDRRSNGHSDYDINADC